MRMFLVAAVVASLGPVVGRPLQPHLMVPPGTLTWRSGANGVATAVAEGDPAKPGQFAMMLKLRMAPGSSRTGTTWTSGSTSSRASC